MVNKDTLTSNGWHLFAHPLFLNQYELLISQVEKLYRKDPFHYKEKNATKRLAAITKLIFDKIPQDPSLPEYRQGITLGEEHKHWFRAKFFQQYRLFFRFHRQSKIIVYAWVNDENTKRAYDNKSDVYRIFKKMLKKGQPPNNWQDLLKEAKNSIGRFKKYKETCLTQLLGIEQNFRIKYFQSYEEVIAAYDISKEHIQEPNYQHEITIRKLKRCL